MAGRKKIEDDNYEKILKDFSNTYFNKELQHAHELFSDKAWPDTEDAKYIQKTTFLINARKSQLMLLKQMAIHLTGIMSSSKDPVKQGSSQAEKLLEQALQRMGIQDKKENLLSLKKKEE